MGFFKNRFIVVVSFLFVFTKIHSFDKEQIIHLIQIQKTEDAVAAYENYKEEIGRHDCALLGQMAMGIMDQGVRSEDPALQALSLYGATISCTSLPLDLLEMGIQSSSFETQLATVKLVARIQDDGRDQILDRAMKSPFWTIRMEAAFCLAQRKHHKATGQIESLMYKMPDHFWRYFPELFALIGTKDSIAVLKNLMSCCNSVTRSVAIINAARFNLDDLLPKIRTCATHGFLDEQEACAFAFGSLQDSQSIEQLKLFSFSKNSFVKLAALQSLYKLGDQNGLEGIYSLCREKDVFAIHLLSDLPGGEDILDSLLGDSDIQVRFNAGLSLLKKQDSRAFPCMEEFLFHTQEDLGFQQQISLGQSLFSWKVIHSVGLRKKSDDFDYMAASFHLRKDILQACLELSEKEFLRIANLIFDKGESSLVPLIVFFLENNPTPEKIDLFKKNSNRCGNPWIRMYCNIVLYRLKIEGPYEDRVKTWVDTTMRDQMVKLSIQKPWSCSTGVSSFDLSSNQTSCLLLEAYKTFADSHEEKAIDLILEGVAKGHKTNKFILAGFLLHVLQ